jgi:Tol biopolymer transport system component
VNTQTEFADTVGRHCIAAEKANLYPSWSPDGTKIIFSSSEVISGAGLYTFNPAPTNLYIWDLNGQSIVKLTDTLNAALLPQWSPDGSKLAYILRDNETYAYALILANPDGTGGSSVAGTEGIRDFDWSPDGKRIVFTQVSPILDDRCEWGCLPFTILKIIDFETGAITTLTDGTQWIGDPSWRP